MHSNLWREANNFVWREMIRSQRLIPKLKKLFSQVPELTSAPNSALKR
ncbi:hypothetical protein ACQZV8_20725 [Magnetococcales bacterium HHB-1]